MKKKPPAKKKSAAPNKVLQKLKAQGRSKQWLADQLGMTRHNLRLLCVKPLSKWKKPYVESLKRLKLV